MEKQEEEIYKKIKIFFIIDIIGFGVGAGLLIFFLINFLEIIKGL